MNANVYRGRAGRFSISKTPDRDLRCNILLGGKVAMSNQADRGSDASHCYDAMHRHAQFYAKLGDLLAEYDVDMIATDDGQSYGQHLPLINVQFNRDGYRSDELKSLSSDEAREMSKVCEDEGG